MKYLAPLTWAATLLIGMGSAYAFELTPISREFAPTGRQATQSYQVRNPSNEVIAVEITVVHRLVDLAGQESHQDAEDDFLIYPPQMLLQPGQAQTVRVTWLGDPAPDQELAYRLVAEQLPVPTAQATNVTRPQGQLQVLMNYRGSLYIRPAQTQANIAVESVEAVNNGNQLALTVSNLGTARAQLRQPRLILTGVNGETVTLEEAQLTELARQVVLAGSRRRFELAWPATLPVGPVTAQFDYDS
jgi:fimbrial chaperone protein